MFMVIGRIDTLDITLNTNHVNDRMMRIAKANELIRVENAKIVGAFEVDTNHHNGNEIHVIYNNGVIRIYNRMSYKHVTDLIGRKAQIERYGVKVTKTMERKINNHVKNGYNNL